MLIRFFVLSSLIILNATDLQAANSCPNVPSTVQNIKSVDLRQEIGPIRDQDSVGWCFGFTSADLLSHYLYKKSLKGWHPFGNIDYREPKNMVSAVGVSSIFNREANKDFFDHLVNAKDANELSSKYKMGVTAYGGSTYSAIDIARKRGICFEKELSSENFGYVKDVRCGANGDCDIDEVLKIIYDSGNEACCQNYSLIKQMFPTFTIDQIRTVLKYSEKRNAINRLVTLACHQTLTPGLFFGSDSSKPIIKNFNLYVPPAPKPNGPAPAKPTPAPAPDPKRFNAYAKSGYPSPGQSLPEDKLVMQIDEALNRGAPAGINYSPSFLVNENAVGREGHASVIVGKFFNPNTCEVNYILRNSWGANCGSVTRENPGYSKCITDSAAIKRKTINDVYAANRACLVKFPALSRNPRIGCDPKTGYMFVPKSDLSAHIHGVTSLVED